jgi:hypothetical protein
MPPVTQAGFAPDLALPPPYQAVRLHNSSPSIWMAHS